MLQAVSVYHVPEARTKDILQDTECALSPCLWFLCCLGGTKTPVEWFNMRMSKGQKPHKAAFEPALKNV